MSNRYIPLSALRERGLYVGIHTWLYTFAYPCQPIEGEGTVIPLINLPPENEKTLGFAPLPSSLHIVKWTHIYYLYVGDTVLSATGDLILAKVRDAIRLVTRDGWLQVRTKGSHHHYKHPSKPGLVTVAGKPQGLFIIGHRIDEIVWITLTPTLSLRELTGVCKVEGQV